MKLGALIWYSAMISHWSAHDCECGVFKKKKKFFFFFFLNVNMLIEAAEYGASLFDDFNLDDLFLGLIIVVAITVVASGCLIRAASLLMYG